VSRLRRDEGKHFEPGHGLGAEVDITSGIPGEKNTGEPSSVARPIASSMASSPLIRRSSNLFLSSPGEKHRRP
jgi:hypothetical protein